MDSTDIDQPSYVLSYGGTATVTTPPYGKPARSRPSSRSSSSSSSSRNSNSSSSSTGAWSRPSGGASRATRPGVSTAEQQGPSAAAAGAGGGSSSSSSSSVFVDIAAGNVSQQVVEQTCLARAVFPLYPASDGGSGSGADTPTAAAAAVGEQGGRKSPAAAVMPRLRVLLFDPEDIEHASPAAAAAAFAAAASSSTSRAVTPSDDTSSSSSSSSGSRGAAATWSSDGRVGSPGMSSPDLSSHPIVIRQDSSDSSSGSNSGSSDGLSDIGVVEVDVQKLLAAAREAKSSSSGGGSSSSSSTSNGRNSSSGRSSSSVRSSSSGSSSSSSGGQGTGTCWEGWVKLDKVGTAGVV
jgi:hypothetical protein